MPSQSNDTKDRLSADRGRKRTRDSRTWQDSVDETFEKLKNLPYEKLCSLSADVRQLLESLQATGQAIGKNLKSATTLHDLRSRWKVLCLERRKEEVNRRKRCTTEEEIHCEVCRDGLDDIFDKGRHLCAALCGHLFCSGCLQTQGRLQNCPRCERPVADVRRLYGV